MNQEDFEKPLVIGDLQFYPGDRGTAQLPIGHLISHEMINLTVHVRRGMEPGARLLLTSAVHGDEINGVEAIRRVLRAKMRRLAGDLIAIPIVNLPAFLNRSRYLPDRRDLNRLFPGNASGSFGARLAYALCRDIARHCTHSIDLHTGALNRPNLPQVRFSNSVAGAKEMAIAFKAPVMMASADRQGTFREEFSRMGKPQILFEGGTAEVLEPTPIKIAIRGVLSVMRHLEMLPAIRKNGQVAESALCFDSYWERAPRGGLFLPSIDLGAVVKKGDLIAKIGDPFSATMTKVHSQRDGVVIGRARNAVIDEGDGIFHIGLAESIESVVENLEAAEAELDHRLDHPVFDDSVDD